ncbi:MAG: hypothetical protein ABJQ63_01885 [Lentilitoribacter sp.]
MASGFDFGWVNALKLPAKVFAGTFLASIFTLILNSQKYIDLDSLHLSAKLVVVLLAVFSGFLWLAAIFDFFKERTINKEKVNGLAVRRKLRQTEKATAQREMEQKLIGRLNHLSAEEIHYVAKCLKEGSPSFYTWADSPAVGQLCAKNLAYSTGGLHHGDHYPFSFYDFVWDAILERQDEFVEIDNDNKQKQAEQEELEGWPRGRIR